MMKTTTEELGVLDQIEKLPTNSFDDKQSLFLMNLTALLEDKQEQLQFAQRMRDEAKQRSRERQRIQWEPLMVAWCKENLSVGDVVKMKGCRDGHGLREIIQIDMNAEYSNLKCHQLKAGRAGWQLRQKGRKAKFNATPVGITDHMWNKVTHLVEIHTHSEGTDNDYPYELIPIKKLIKEELIEV